MTDNWEHYHIGSQLLQDLGGKDNINKLDHCATRLRIFVKNKGLVNDRDIIAHGGKAVFHIDSTQIHIVIGPNVGKLKAVMGNFLSEPLQKDNILDLTKKESFIFPLYGNIVFLEDVPDQVFANKLLGEGFAIDPIHNEVIAPVDGKVITIFPTKHAIHLKSKNGANILIHIGIDTVHLNGEGFVSYIQEGDRISQGQTLLTFHLSLVKNKATSSLSPIVWMNS